MPQPGYADYQEHRLLVNQGFLLSLLVSISLHNRSFLPSLQGQSSHHAPGGSFGQWQLHMSHCSMPAGCLFSFGGAHDSPASYKHLPPPAYAFIPLHPSGSLHLSASLCVPLHVWVARVKCWAREQLLAPPASPSLRNSQIWQNKSCWTLCPPCVLRGHLYCVSCTLFVITLPLAQVPFSWSRQVCLQCSSVRIAVLELAQRACIWGGMPSCSGRPPSMKFYLFF